MHVTFLGTGTSHGVPVIGCDCDVCRSENPKNARTRSSIWVQSQGKSVLVDTANEFRIQALQAGITEVDAVLYTHCHADHVFGFDDLRIFSQRSGQPIPIYGNASTLEEMHHVFNYVFRETQRGGGKPQVTPIVVEGTFDFGGLTITPIPIFHGRLPIYGYRIGSMAYVTDCSAIPDASLPYLEGLDALILGVIRHEPHTTHLHVEAALALIAQCKPQRSYFTHISHRLEHDVVHAELPPDVMLAYDGLEILI